MPESHTKDAPVPPVAGEQPTFRRRFRGYDRNLVDQAVTNYEAKISDLASRLEVTQSELADTRASATDLRNDLTRARAELRYWNDRSSYIDSEVARARSRAQDIEQSAQSRAEAVEADAQERSLQLIDRVCLEAAQIMQAARDEAREMFLRFESDVDMSQQKIDKLESIRTDLATSVQNALRIFEKTVTELDKASPTKRVIEQVSEPVRRQGPTFGQQKAVEAAQRFDHSIHGNATQALSTPLPDILKAAVHDSASSPSSRRPAGIATIKTPDIDQDEELVDNETESFRKMLTE